MIYNVRKSYLLDVYNITERQKLIIRKGLIDYQYIMKNWKSNDADFRRVYYDFYLKAAYSRTSKKDFQDKYFEQLQKKDEDLLSIIESLRQNDEDCYEFSFVTKLLHTRNPNNPIYDSKVQKYLLMAYNVPFLWNRGSSKEKKIIIENDWQELKNWYKWYIPSEEGGKWLLWFDEEFNKPDISPVKKIDFIIFASG